MGYRLSNISYQYINEADNANSFTLGPIDLNIPSGKVTFICGRSGSGKSTLLAILGLLRTEFSGKLYIDDLDSSTLIKKKDDLYNYRLNNIGFALQKGRLLPYLSVKENSEFILQYLGHTKEQITSMSEQVFSRLFKVERVEDEDSYNRILNSLPEDVSGGQYQRAALARALINDPTIVLADEPTGNLDVNSGEKAMQLLRNYVKDKEESSVVIVSHDLEYARIYGDNIVILKEGIINGQANRIDELSWKSSEGEIFSNREVQKYLTSKIKDDE